MNKNNFKGILCLHPNFAAQYKYFDENNIFKIKKRCYEQDLFAKASLLVTDYSSIFFDFGYIKKPVIYTQFDYEEYRNNHFSKGYFDYKKDGFGKICYDMQCTINAIISEIENKCELKNLYYKRIKRFFKFHDDNNCYRVYMEIINGKYKEKSLYNYLEYNEFVAFLSLILKIIIFFYNYYYF